LPAEYDTEPLSPAAAAALERLERAFIAAPAETGLKAVA
jgi:hypothetical protein